MAGEEAERVGGISIEASIDDSQVDAGLNALLSKIEAASKRLSGALSVTPGINAAGQPARQAAPQQASLTFGPRAAGFRGNETAIQRAINEQLAKEGKQMVDGVVVALDTAQRQTSANLARAVSGPTSSAAVEIQLDPSEFRAQFGEFLGELKTMMRTASQAATVSVSTDDGEPGTGGGGARGGLRRKRLRDRGIGTEANQQNVYTYDPAVYEAEDARREAASTRQRETLLTQQSRRKQTASDSEQRFLNALAGPDAGATDERRMRELSYEAAAAQAGVRTSSTLVPQRSEREKQRLREEEQRRLNQAPQPRTFGGDPGRAARQIGAIQGEGDTATGRGRAPAGGGRGRGLDEGDLARREEQQIATSEAQRLTAARTARTFASGLGGFFLGQTRQQTEASIGLRRAEQELQIARRRLYDPQITGNVRAYRQASEEVAVAENNVAGALEKVQAFSTGTSAARTLASVTVAGAAFGIGLKAIDFGLEAVSLGLKNFIDLAGGFGGTSARVTAQLGQQSRALHGNAEAALANAEATAGISATASAAIDPQLRLVTQIKAGAQAMAEASDLFRASAGIGNAPTGLAGGFGGVLGTSLFAQQLGGGRGFSELAAENIRAAAGGPVRADLQTNAGPLGLPGLGLQFRPETAEEAATAVEAVGVQLESLNDAARRGARLTGDLARVEFARTDNINDIARAQTAAAAAGNTYFEGLAKDLGIVVRLNGEVADTGAELNKALQLAATGQGIPDTAQLKRAALAQQQREFDINQEVQTALTRRQQQRELPSILAGAQRQQQFALGTQQPAEQALANLTQPLLPVGTGIATNVGEQGRLAAGLARSQEIQDDLNAGYEKGRQILATTYQVPLQLLTQIQGVGQEIAGLQASISNEQAAYQTAQYNFQLQIARRTLSDIGGLTGKNFGAGESYLGVLERQNLALSRQAQLLQFALAQRQINFQQAVAGFQAPGVTPEERQANVKEAEIEANFAQKQLDIQRQMFGNQVQIVDIQNLRQGADLAMQIGLLLQGREVTIDTAQAQERIGLLQQQQAILVAQAGTYLTRINSLTSVAFGQIQQLEAAAGRAMASAAASVLSSFGIVLNGLTNQLGGFSSTTETQPGKLKDDRYNASGYVGTTAGKTMTGVGWMGEANQEAYAILRNPKPIGDLGGLGGNSTVIVNFNGDIHADQQGDLDKITRAVIAGIGRGAALSGLRLGN